MHDKKFFSSQLDLELTTTKLAILKENKQYELLAINYSIIGNNKLRDKYIELALKQHPFDQSEIFLRHLQDKIQLVASEKIEKEINRNKENKDWSQLARLYDDVKDYENAIIYYCKDICESLEEGNIFSAGYYLKELSKKELFKPLFEKSFRKYVKEKDLWWQVRSLQELG